MASVPTSNPPPPTSNPPPPAINTDVARGLLQKLGMDPQFVNLNSFQALIRPSSNSLEVAA